jgi:hypothetical protein
MKPALPKQSEAGDLKIKRLLRPVVRKNMHDWREPIADEGDQKV